MQSTIVQILAGLAKSAWPILQPILIQVVQQLAAELIARAKAQKLPDNVKFLEPVVADLESKLGDFLSPDKIKAELDKLIPQAS